MRKQFLTIVLLCFVVVVAEAADNSFSLPGSWPTGLAYDGNVLYFLDANGSRPIFRLDPSDGTVLGAFTSGVSIGGIEFDGVDRLFVTGFFNPGDPAFVREIALYEPDGGPHTIFNEFSVPFRVNSVAFDGTNLYLHDWDSGRFLVTNRAGVVLADLTTGLRITDMVFDPMTGNIWALDIFGTNISEITTSGTRLRTCETPRVPRRHGIGAVTLVGSDLYIAENNPAGTGTIYVVNKASLVCDPPLSSTVLTIDEDSISKDLQPNFFSAEDVNEDLADIGLRAQLPFFAAHIGDTITLHTGEVGDEGWFALTSIPESWDVAGPNGDGLSNFLQAGPGLGSPDAVGDREALLDKVPGVTPLRATGLKALQGRRVCAVVFKSDVSINYDPLNGSLKGDNLGVVALSVLDVQARLDTSSSALPAVTVEILDASQICQEVAVFEDAPTPTSSSKPLDVIP